MRQLITIDIILLGDEMEVFFVVALIQSYSGLKLCSPFKNNTVRKNVFFWVFVTAWIQKSPCVRWTNCTFMVDLLVMVIHTSTVCCVTLKCFVYMPFCTMLLGLCIQRRGKDQVIAIWFNVDQTRVCLVISQDFFFVSIWSFLYLPFSTDSTVEQNSLT